MTAPPPPSLKPVTPFLKHAQQLETVDPVMSYFCRYYAVHLGIKIRSTNPDEDTKKFLVGQMDKLEELKTKIGSKIEEPGYGEAYVRNFALRVFKMADDEDRAGKANKKTVLNFLSAAQFFESISQFGELTNEVRDFSAADKGQINEKIKYSKWKAANISGALKRGEVPKIGGPNEHVEPPASSSSTSSEAMDFPDAPSFGDLGFPSFPTVSHSSEFPPIPSSSSSSEPKLPPGAKPTPFSGMGTPSLPNPSPVPPPTLHSPAPAPSPSPSPSSSSSYEPVRETSGYSPSDEDLAAAMKYSRFVVSSLQFDDIPSAVKNLRLALQRLTGAPH